MPPPPTVLFVHIPKTAGTTVSSIIEGLYPVESVVSLPGERLEETIAELAALPREEQERIAVVKGHMTFGLDALWRAPCRYATFLRDPLARVVSGYRHYLRVPQNRFGAIIARERLGLAQYLERTEFLDSDNRQTRFLAGHGPPSSLGFTLGFEKVDETHLAAAKRNLEEAFDFVGITERFDESLLGMARTFGWRLEAYSDRNVAPGGRTRRVPSDLAEMIVRRNRFDYELYEFGNQLLDRRIASFGRSFKRDLRRFAARKALGRAYREAEPWVAGFPRLHRRLGAAYRGLVTLLA